MTVPRTAGDRSSPDPVTTAVLAVLEPDQLVSHPPVQRAVLSAPVRAALWALRIVALLLSAAVIFTFVCEIAR